MCFERSLFVYFIIGDPPCLILLHFLVRRRGAMVIKMTFLILYRLQDQTIQEFHLILGLENVDSSPESAGYLPLICCFDSNIVMLELLQALWFSMT